MGSQKIGETKQYGIRVTTRVASDQESSVASVEFRCPYDEAHKASRLVVNSADLGTVGNSGDSFQYAGTSGRPLLGDEKKADQQHFSWPTIARNYLGNATIYSDVSTVEGLSAFVWATKESILEGFRGLGPATINYSEKDWTAEITFGAREGSIRVHGDASQAGSNIHDNIEFQDIDGAPRSARYESNGSPNHDTKWILNQIDQLVDGRSGATRIQFQQAAESQVKLTQEETNELLAKIFEYAQVVDDAASLPPSRE